MENNHLRSFKIPKILSMLNPSYSCCEKCGLPWKFCKSKSVSTNEDSGTFATCYVCWDNSSLDELKGYYTTVYIMQEKSVKNTEYNLKHTLDHLLKCVEEEYIKTNS